MVCRLQHFGAHEQYARSVVVADEMVVFKMYPKKGTICVHWIHLAQDLVNGGPNTTANLQVSGKVGNF